MLRTTHMVMKLATFFDEARRNGRQTLGTKLGEALKESVDYLIAEHDGVYPTMTYEEVETGKRDGKIAAIKMVRSRLGYGLTEAKSFVENEASRLGFDFGGYGY